MTILFTFIFIIVKYYLCQTHFNRESHQCNKIDNITDEAANFHLLSHSVKAVGAASENRADAFLYSDWIWHLLHTLHDHHYRP